jgi:hypothetical protein
MWNRISFLVGGPNISHETHKKKVVLEIAFSKVDSRAFRFVTKLSHLVFLKYRNFRCLQYILGIIIIIIIIIGNLTCTNFL